MRRNNGWLTGLILVLGLIPGLSWGADVPGEPSEPPLPVPESEAAPILPEVSGDVTEAPISLEELELMVAPRQVCGVYCAHNPSNRYCTTACGEAAGCIGGYCVYF